jgi:hypothetical protein
MVKRIFGLSLALILLVSALAYAQALMINGTIQNLRPVVFGDKSAILLSLKGRSETYVVRTVDAPKFGLLKPETAAAPDQAKMAKELVAAKGWMVKLAVAPKPNTKPQEYAVQSLERLPDKPDK